jgi:pilus assembly protein CpaE
MMGLRPGASIGQLLNGTTNRLSAEEISSHLLKHKTGVHLLASSPGFGQNESMGSDQVLKLVSSVKSYFPVILLDIPHLLDPHISPILQLIDKVVLVLTPDMPSVQATVTALQGLMSLGYSQQQTMLVVNQTMPHNGLPVETIQKAVRRKVSAVVPFEADMVKATNTGKPLLMLSPQSAASAAIAQLSTKLFG